MCKCGTCKNIDPAENQKKAQRTGSMTFTSNEGSLMQHDDEEEQEPYQGEVSRKKLKSDTKQINAFSSASKGSRERTFSFGEDLSGEKPKKKSSGKTNKISSYPNYSGSTLKEQE